MFEKRYNFFLKHPLKRLIFFTLSYIIIKLSVEKPKWWNGRRDGLKIHCW